MSDIKDYIIGKHEDGAIKYRLVATLDDSIVYDGEFETTDALMENGIRKAETAVERALEEDYAYELHEAETNQEEY